MEILASTAQMKELDRIAIEERGIPSLELMENAAQAVAQAVMDLVGEVEQPEGEDGVLGGATSVCFMVKTGEEPTAEEQREMEELRSIVESKNTDPTQRIGIFCGPGNNGGDGVAAARILLEAGYRVRAFLVGDREKMTPDERAMEEKLREAGGELESLDLNDQHTTVWMSTCDCFVDALFGVGLQRPLAGEFLTLVQWLNRMHTPVVSCDLPSGVHGDTGEILGDAVQAKVTVTFTCAKPGLYLDAGAGRAGEVRAVDIGIPWELLNRQIWSAPEQSWAMPGDVCRNLPSRPVDGHKGDFGKLFLLAGSEGYTGAPNLAARAALRTGAGLVFLGVPREIYPILAVKCDEAMPFPLPNEYSKILQKARSCDVAVIGPGLGQEPRTQRLVRSLLEDLDIPVVLDADGINALVGHIDILDKRSAPTVLTPHAGEYARLTGTSLPVRDRLTAARSFAKEHRCTLVLKGHGTVTAAPSGQCWVCGTGNPGMAKGGSGDVLSGMIAALWGQKHLVEQYTDLSELAAWAVWIHGKAGDVCAQKLGEYAMLPSDLLDAIPQVLMECTEPEI